VCVRRCWGGERGGAAVVSAVEESCVCSCPACVVWVFFIQGVWTNRPFMQGMWMHRPLMRHTHTTIEPRSEGKRRGDHVIVRQVEGLVLLLSS